MHYGFGLLARRHDVAHNRALLALGLGFATMDAFADRIPDVLGDLLDGSHRAALPACLRSPNVAGAPVLAGLRERTAKRPPIPFLEFPCIKNRTALLQFLLEQFGEAHARGRC